MARKGYSMLFNLGKVTAYTHDIGSEKEVGNITLSATIKQKGLGVTISTDTNVLKHCGVSAFEGSQIIGVIRRNECIQKQQPILRLHIAIEQLSMLHTSYDAMFYNGH